MGLDRPESGNRWPMAKAKGTLAWMGLVWASAMSSPGEVSRYMRHRGRRRKEERAPSAVLPSVLDVDAVAQRRVDRAVAIAGEVDRFINRLLVEVSRPAGDESDFD